MSTARNVELAMQGVAYRMRREGLSAGAALYEAMKYNESPLVAFAVVELMAAASEDGKVALRRELRERLHAGDSWDGLT